jgi:hypothetical protein
MTIAEITQIFLEASRKSEKETAKIRAPKINGSILKSEYR